MQHLKATAAQQLARFHRTDWQGFFVELALRHYVAGGGVPGVVLPEGEHPTGHKGIMDIAKGGGALAGCDMVENTVGKCQLELRRRKKILAILEFYAFSLVCPPSIQQRFWRDIHSQNAAGMQDFPQKR